MTIEVTNTNIENMKRDLNVFKAQDVILNTECLNVISNRQIKVAQTHENNKEYPQKAAAVPNADSLSHEYKQNMMLTMLDTKTMIEDTTLR